jgi:hypothetical protein
MKTEQMKFRTSTTSSSQNPIDIDILIEAARKLREEITLKDGISEEDRTRSINVFTDYIEGLIKEKGVKNAAL